MKIGKLRVMVFTTSPREFKTWAFRFKADGARYIGVEFFGVVVSTVWK